MTDMPLPKRRAARIARAYLPSRWHYHYVRAKLASDPLYPGVVEALRGSNAPLLDIGCGVGLLAHALREAGLDMPYAGLDNHAEKIAQAQRAAATAGLPDVRFELRDAAAVLPAHRGSVALLDVLQFIAPELHDSLLTAVVDMLTPDARLVIRTGLDDGSRRARFTRAVDAFSRTLRWMNAGPQRYPDADALRARFDAAGLRAEFRPLHGRTPFNNWLVVARPQ